MSVAQIQPSPSYPTQVPFLFPFTIYYYSTSSSVLLIYLGFCLFLNGKFFEGWNFMVFMFIS